MTTWLQTVWDWRLPKRYHLSMCLKGLQSCRLSNFFHFSKIVLFFLCIIFSYENNATYEHFWFPLILPHKWIPDSGRITDFLQVSGRFSIRICQQKFFPRSVKKLIMPFSAYILEKKNNWTAKNPYLHMSVPGWQIVLEQYSRPVLSLTLIYFSTLSHINHQWIHTYLVC